MAGQLGDRDDILFVMAVDHEYGPELRARIRPLFTGVGPVEAAVVVAAELAARKSSGRRTALVVSLGSAGSRRLPQGEVYQASSVSYRDMDATALGFEKGRTPFLDLPANLPVGPCLPGIPAATLSTGANIVSGAAYDLVDTDMVDMETYAVLRACQRFGVPLLALRGISDGASELRRLEDWTQYLHIVDARLASVVDRLVSARADGEFP